MTKDEALRMALEALETAIHPWEKEAAITAIKEALAQPEHCSDCGQKLGDVNHIHTCSPQRKWVWLTNGELADILKRGDVAEHDAEKGLWHVLPYQFAKAVEIKLKEKNT